MSKPQNTAIWFDAHCHLYGADFDISGQVCQEHEHIPCQYLNCVLSQTELTQHQAKALPRVMLSAGIHPYYQTEHPLSLTDLETLAQNNSLIAIGEAGLDKRNPDLASQKKLFTAQLKLAAKYRLPLVVHSVRAWNEIAQLVINGYAKQQLVLHGFNGPLQLAKMLGRLNSVFSISPRLLSRKDAPEVLAYIIERGSWCFETDAPFATTLNSLTQVVQTTSQLTQKSVTTLLQGQWLPQKG